AIRGVLEELNARSRVRTDVLFQHGMGTISGCIIDHNDFRINAGAGEILRRRGKNAIEDFANRCLLVVKRKQNRERGWHARNYGTSWKGELSDPKGVIRGGNASGSTSQDLR